MASRTYIGGAGTTAQVNTCTPGGTLETTDKLIHTLTDEAGNTATLTVTTIGTTVATAVAAVVAAWNASTNSMFAAITAVNTSSTHMTLTADTAGTPFYLAVSTTETDDSPSDGQTYVTATTVPSSGPRDWNVAANWFEHAVPVAADHVTLTGSNQILYGLQQASVAIGSFTVDKGATLTVGAGAGQPLDIDPDAFECHGTITGYFDINAAAISPRITAGTRITIKGSAIATLRVDGGTVHVCASAGDTATVATSTVQSPGTLILGTGTTATTVNHAGGTTTLYVAATTVTADAGTLTTEGTGAITTMNNNGATIYPNSSGTITTLNANKGTTDFSHNRIAKTVTTLNHFRGATVARDSTVVTVTTYVPPTGLTTLAAS